MTDTAISALSAASAFTGTEVLPVVVGGVSKKSTTLLLAEEVASENLVTFVGANTASGASPAPSVPSGIASGDFCLFLCATNNIDADAAGPEGAGWTLIRRENPTTGENVYAWYKTAGGSEPATWPLTTSNTAGSPNVTACVVAAWRGGTLNDIVWNYRYHYSMGPEPAAGGVAIYGFLAALEHGSDPTSPLHLNNFNFSRSTNSMTCVGWRPISHGGDAGDVSLNSTQSTNYAALAISLRPS